MPDEEQMYWDFLMELVLDEDHWFDAIWNGYPNPRCPPFTWMSEDPAVFIRYYDNMRSEERLYWDRVMLNAYGSLDWMLIRAGVPHSLITPYAPAPVITSLVFLQRLEILFSLPLPPPSPLYKMLEEGEE